MARAPEGLAWQLSRRRTLFVQTKAPPRLTPPCGLDPRRSLGRLLPARSEPSRPSRSGTGGRPGGPTGADPEDGCQWMGVAERGCGLPRRLARQDDKGEAETRGGAWPQALRAAPSPRPGPISTLDSAARPASARDRELRARRLAPRPPGPAAPATTMAPDPAENRSRTANSALLRHCALRRVL